MYQKVKCTCRVVVLVIKPIAFLTFSWPSLLLKLPKYRASTAYKCQGSSRIALGKVQQRRGLHAGQNVIIRRYTGFTSIVSTNTVMKSVSVGPCVPRLTHVSDRLGFWKLGRVNHQMVCMKFGFRF